MWTLALSFARKNWQALAVGLLIAIVVWRIYSIVDERDDAINALTQERHATEVATLKRNAELVAKREQAKQEDIKREAKYATDLQYAVGLYVKGFTREKAQDKQVIAGLRNDIADSLREQQAIYDRFRVPEDGAGQVAGSDVNAVPVGHGGAAGEESPEFYRNAYKGASQYIRTLETAGAICAADFNACHAYVKDEQSRLGIENSGATDGTR